MTTYARFVTRNAELSSDFAKSFIERRYGKEACEAIYAALPVYSKGKRQGQVKGSLFWNRCETGGWHKDEGRVGGVVRPGTITGMVIRKDSFQNDGGFGLDYFGFINEDKSFRALTDEDKARLNARIENIFTKYESRY